MVETGATLGGEQSGHVVDLGRHTTGDGLATALSLLAALGRLGMSMDEAGRLITPYPQKLVAVAADRSALAGADAVWAAVDAEAREAWGGWAHRGARVGHRGGCAGDGGGGRRGHV